jgi:glycosyltransferase involved in cell wall biosynthesis
MTPLVSIIIPTANRPDYLPRAVGSALSGMASKDVEIIVVPNGSDESWRESLLSYQNNPSVRVVRISEANANIARNAGLAKARGKYVRFLDDDDYLIPEGAIKQYELIQVLGTDVVSGSVQLVNDHGRCFDVWHQPNIEDFCSAVLGPWRVCLPLAHVYRHSILKIAQWNPATSGRQDVEWLLDLCAAMELRWKRTNDVAGVWHHHWGQRISSSQQFKEIRNKMTVPMLLKTYEILQREGRLNETRRQATSLGLWDFIHSAFFLEPAYWTRIARIAQRIYPTARPMHTIYRFPLFCHLNPLIIQWVMLPKRLIFHKIRMMHRRFHINQR